MKDSIIAPLEFHKTQERIHWKAQVPYLKQNQCYIIAIQRKTGDVKLKSVSKAVQDKPKEHIVFAKEFTPTRKVEKNNKESLKLRNKERFQDDTAKEEKSMLEKEQAPKKIWFEIAQNKQTEEQSQLLINKKKRIRLEKEKAQETFMLDQRKKKRRAIRASI